MNPRFIRAAIAFYPPEWRRRYGSELEELVLESCAASASKIRAACLIAGVAACGMRERVPRPIARRMPRAWLALATVAAAAVTAFAVDDLGRWSSAPTAAPPTPITLAPHPHIGGGVHEVYRSWLSGVPATGRSLLSLDPASGNVVEASGAPVQVKINPRTKQVVAVTPMPH